jgi:hypothetical protein
MAHLVGVTDSSNWICHHHARTFHSSLPACFFYAGNLSFVCQFTETNTTETELTIHRMRTAATLTASILANFKLLRTLLLHDHRFLGQVIPSSCLIGDDQD